MRAVITGASGFVGRHLSEYLHSQDWDVVGIGLGPGPQIPGVQMAVCDLRDADHTARVIRHMQPDYIFHLAAQAYVPQSLAAPADTLTNNAVAQINVVEACRAAGLDPVIVVVSSAEVYGAAGPEAMPLREDCSFRPTNPYAVSKATQDLLALQYHLSYGMKIVRVRPFNHIGPGQSDRFVVSSFARQIAEAEAGRSDPVMLVGNLDAQRDFLDVRDVIRAYVQVARPEFAGEVFNVASGKPHSIKSILDNLLSLASISISVERDPARMRPADEPLLVGDASKLRQATGWQPEIPVEQSLVDTLDYWRANVRCLDSSKAS